MPRLQHAGRYQHLADVTLTMFGGMEEQALNGCGDLLSSDEPRLGQGGFRGVFQLTDRRFYLRPEGIGQVGRLYRNSGYFFFGGQVLKLQTGERFSTRIGEKPVDNSTDVEEVKANRCNAARRFP